MTVQEEPALEPERPIIDPHLHIWHIMPTEGSLMSAQRFLFDEVRETIERSGHNITHTVFVECGAMHRADGPEDMRCIGETEFVNGVAAMSASGHYGDTLIAHRIVSTANLLLGSAVRPVLEAHRSAAGERFRGIRMSVANSDEGLFGFPCDPGHKGLMTRDAFREGARELARMDLSLDVWCLHTQLDELIALADALPDLSIVLDHIGTPECTGIWANRQEEAFAQWSERMTELAKRPNVTVKLGGLGMNMTAILGKQLRGAPSDVLAGEWRQRIEICIEAFGADRCMFESNFPPDNDSGSYGATWNAFKIIAKDYSDAEKGALFRGTAARVYRIE